MLNWTVHFYPKNSITYFSYDRSFLFELDISSSIHVRIKLRAVANGMANGFRETLSTIDLYEEVVGLNPNFWWLKEDIFYPNA